MSPHFGQNRRDFWQTYAVAAEAFRHRQCGHTPADERVPSQFPFQHGRDNVGDSLLCRSEIEIHQDFTEEFPA